VLLLNIGLVVATIPDHGRYNISTYMEIEPAYEQKRKEKSTRKKKKDIRDLKLQTII